MKKKNQKCNGLRLITHVIGEVLVVFGSVFIAINIISDSPSSTFYLFGITAVIVGAFCQWNPV